jgi:hypothetical protein
MSSVEITIIIINIENIGKKFDKRKTKIYKYNDLKIDI